MPKKPILSPLARPGRRYISGIVYLVAAFLLIGLLFLGRACVVHQLAR